MDIQPIFSIGVGRVKVPEALESGRTIFAESQNILSPIRGDEGRRTTLTNYLRKTRTYTHEQSESWNHVKEVIRANALKFYAGCGYHTEGYDVEVMGMWLNEMQSGTSHRAHSHYGARISGCFYVEVPENSGKISFINPYENEPLGTFPNKEFTSFNSYSWWLSLEAGDMLFWRSDIRHEVPEAEFEGVRRCIAFDINVVIKD